MNPSSRIPASRFHAIWIGLLLAAVHQSLTGFWFFDVKGVGASPFLTLLLGVALGVLFKRWSIAGSVAHSANVELEARLAKRSRELEESHRKLRAVEHEQAVAGERQRLMREMHDGLGSSLMSSLVMVEQGKLDSRQVATVLRESIDDLKLTIDSLEPMGDDLLTLLGTLRYRLGKRLEAANIKLEWLVQETPTLPWLNPTTSLQILRMLQEALTNTLKHAQATVIRVETHVEGAHVTIRLVDNGRGFDVVALQKSPTGRGLQNLQRRATTIDAQIEIVSRPGETIVALRLSRERRSVDRSNQVYFFKAA